MGAVTYPEPAVVEAVNTRFVPLQIDVTRDDAKPLIDRFREAWTPDVRVLGPDGFDYYRWNGYLPPFEFLPQLLVAQAHTCLRMNDPVGAASICDDVLHRFPTSAVAPEAAYFLAVAKYKSSQEPADLLEGWQWLQSAYPDSVWRVKQLFTERRITWAGRAEAA